MPLKTDHVKKCPQAFGNLFVLPHGCRQYLCNVFVLAQQAAAQVVHRLWCQHLMNSTTEHQTQNKKNKQIQFTKTGDKEQAQAQRSESQPCRDQMLLTLRSCIFRFDFFGDCVFYPMTTSTNSEGSPYWNSSGSVLLEYWNPSLERVKQDEIWEFSSRTVSAPVVITSLRQGRPTNFIIQKAAVSVVIISSAEPQRRV